jgi:GNAT superfamily N-acetyltransferase
MNIRPVELAELTQLAKLGEKFWAEGKLPGKFVPEVFVKTWDTFHQLGMGAIIGLFDGANPVGAIGAIAYPDPNDGELVVTETFWFVDPAHRGAGLKLLDAFEAWAMNRGAKRIVLVHLVQLAPEVLRRLYLRKGYQEIEVHFIKSL